MGSDALVDMKLCLYSSVATCVVLSVILYICVYNFIPTRMISRGITWSEGFDSHPSSCEESWVCLGVSAGGNALRCIGRTADFVRRIFCCAVVRRKSASLRLMSMRSDAIYPHNNSDFGIIGSLFLVHFVSPTCRLLVSRFPLQTR
jgi:hypothetical protein